MSPDGASRKYPPRSPVWITMASGGRGVAVVVKVGVTVGVVDIVGVALAVNVAVIVGVPVGVGVKVGVIVGVGSVALTEKPNPSALPSVINPMSTTAMAMEWL